MNKHTLLSLAFMFILVCLTMTFLLAQEFNQVYVINPLLGKVIDRAERDKYELFPEITGFQSATAYKQSDGSYYLRVTLVDEISGKERTTLILRDEVVIQKIRNQIDDIEKPAQPEVQPAGVITEEELKIQEPARGLLTHPKHFFILNGTWYTGIGSDRTEWKSAYSMGAYSYYSLSDKVAIGYRFAFTQCTINDKYDLIPAMDRAMRVDLSRYKLDTAAGSRSMIEILPSIRVAMRRNRNTILSMQYSVGVYLLRQSDVVVKGYYKEGNLKSVLTISNGHWTREAIAYNYYDDGTHTSKSLGLACIDYANDNMGIPGSKLGYSVGLSYNIKNIVDIQPTFTFVSREFMDLFDFKNCYLSLTLSLIVPEEIITNPPRPMPQN